MLKKKLSLLSGFSLTAAILFSCATISVNAQDSRKAIAASDIAFEQIAPFVKMGAAWGDRATGKHGTFGEFPGHASSPSHTHTGAYHGVVISGTMINPFEGESNPTKMGPGSYWHVPAGTTHVTACISDDPCRFYFHAEGAFDFSPAK